MSNSKLSNIDFAVLDISGKDYLPWTLDAEIHLTAKELGETIQPGNTASAHARAKAMIFLRYHLHEDLKKEYLTVKDLLLLWESLKERIMPPKSTPLTQAAIRRMIRESVDAAIAAERARHANAGNDAIGSRPVRGQDVALAVCECTFDGFMKCNPTVFLEGKKIGGGEGWVGRGNAKVATMGLETVNQMPWTEMKQLMTVEFCPIEEVQRIEHELWNLKVKEYNIVAYTQRLIEQKSTNLEMKEYWNERKQRVKAFKQWNARAMITDPTEGKESSGTLPMVLKCCFTHNVGQVKIKCHKCGKVRHKARHCKEKSVATGANAQPIPTCHNYGEQCHNRNRCPRKVKQEETGEVYGRSYTIKDAEPQGRNVVTGTFLLNNRYTSILFDSGSDRSFVDTRFSSMLNIEPVKISASYEVELADRRVVSTNTVLKGCTLNLVNHLFKIDLMPIELGTFDIIIGMDWLVKHDAVIVCGEKVVCIPYGNKMLIVESEKGVSRLKVISCIKAYVLVIRDFPEVFPNDLPGLPPPRQVEFRINLVSGAAPVARVPYRLTPSEMRELSVQLQELLEKGFIRPSSSP
ncbi:putative reverse transcriptase domain-containing protein [Tanacetum coccineum]